MFVPGQRWMSTAEPELGLGTVLRVEGRSVQVLFAQSGVIRQYAQHSAPLLRAAFRSGQTVAGQGRSLRIVRVEETGGLLRYIGRDGVLEEGELDDEQSLSHADERLISGRVDPVDRFELRLEALQRRAAARGSRAWGLNAARIDLLDHQLRVAARATAQRMPRVLLADEVGLGKTIEAGLIMSRQLAAGRVRRVLVMVPENLVHQWFVELLRRFNLNFSIFDRARLASMDAAAGNPFEDAQLVLVSREFLLAEGAQQQFAIHGDWDMLVVDEAHHLHWTPQEAGPDYRLVEQLAAQTPALILLTATPEQAGRSGHFARLRLLDPARYSDLQAYRSETEGYLALSPVAEKLAAGATLTPAECQLLFERYPQDMPLRELILRHADGPEARRALLDALVDRHGTGRVMFRNRRDLIGGFPARRPHLSVLPMPADGDRLRQDLLEAFIVDIGEPDGDIEHDYAADPRLAWLKDLLAAHPQDKCLLICRSRAKVQALDAALAGGPIRYARFHEGLGLLQRDRNAASFAEPDGAQLLLSSEIGSEGRNFQFAQRLVLWDLPLDPDVLEQRIGRLDRIGRGDRAIDIHVAVIEGSAQQVLMRWYHDALDAFRSSPADGRALLGRFGALVAQLGRQHAAGDGGVDEELEVLLAESAAAHRDMAERIQQGRDRLLELSMARAPDDDALGAALRDADADTDAHEFMQRLLEHFGVQLDDLGSGVIRMDPEYLATDALPGFAGGTFSATFDRAVALHRDDLPLIRFDHPLMLGALDLLLGSEQGNAAFMSDASLNGKQALLQAVFVLECVADASLEVQRFLPATPLTVTVDTTLRVQPYYTVSAQALARAAQQPIDMQRYRKFVMRLLPSMLEAAEEAAQKQAQSKRQASLDSAEKALNAELRRLEALKAVNPSIDERDLKRLRDERDGLRQALPAARLRLDALRMVVSPQFLDLR